MQNDFIWETERGELADLSKLRWARSDIGIVKTNLKIMARPKLKDKEVRNRNINVALNFSEYEKISVLAKVCKRKIATYMREISLDGNKVKFVPSVNKELSESILEMQWSLNRLAGSLEQEKLSNADIRTLRDIQNNLRQIHQELIGNGNN